MTSNTTTEPNAAKSPVSFPIRCSVCGKTLTHLYPNTTLGKVFATCCSGHKTSYRMGELSRKAV